MKIEISTALLREILELAENNLPFSSLESLDYLWHALESTEREERRKNRTHTPLDRLKHHVTGAIERGEKNAIVSQPQTDNEVAAAIAKNEAKAGAEYKAELLKKQPVKRSRGRPSGWRKYKEPEKPSTTESLSAEIERLKAENEALNKKKPVAPDTPLKADNQSMYEDFNRRNPRL